MIIFPGRAYDPVLPTDQLATKARRPAPYLSCHLTAPYFFRVAAAFFAAREREAAERLAATLRACRDSAFLDAAL